MSLALAHDPRPRPSPATLVYRWSPYIPWPLLRSECVDLFAPGMGIYSAWHSSNSTYYIASGTSTAAPHVVPHGGFIARDQV